MVTRKEIRSKVFAVIDDMRNDWICDGCIPQSHVEKYLESIDILDIHMGAIFDMCAVLPDDETTHAYITSLVYHELMNIRRIASEFCDDHFLKIIDDTSNEFFVKAMA